MGVGDRPNEITQSQSKSMGIASFFRLFKARTEFLLARIPVNIFVLCICIFLAELLQHGIKGFSVCHLREIIERRTFRFIQIKGWVFRAVYRERRLIHIDHRPTRR